MAVIRITVIEGENVGETTTFGGERLVMGRGTTNDLIITDGAVSRQHAAIEQVADEFFLVDLNSNNGTFIRGEKDRVTRRKLLDGDVIALGQTRLKVAVPNAAADAEATRISARPDVPLPAAATKPPPATGAPTLAPGKVGVQKPSDLPIVLTVVSGADRGMVYSPSKDITTIGRLATSDVPLNDPAVSRLHATIKREPHGYAIYDEGSSYGITMVNTGKRVFHEQLTSGDRVRIGETELLVEIGSGKGAQAAAEVGPTMSAAVGTRTFSMTIRGVRARPVVADDVTQVGLAPPNLDATIGPGGIQPPSGGPPPPPEPPPPPPQPRIILRIVGGPDAGRAIEPPAGTARFTVGRSDKSDHPINDAGISGLHFSITFENGEFTMKDEGSRNGVFVNKKPDKVPSLKLQGGEEIRVGETDIRIEIIRPDAPLAAAAARPDSTMVVAAPSAVPKPTPTPATPPGAGAPAPAAKAGGKPVLPEMERSREAKDRISKIMKGVSLRPIRRPGTIRQWSGVALVLAAVLISYLFPRTWVAAGPVFHEHAPIEQKCETCHSSESTFHLMSVVSSSTKAMNTSCAAADCHAKVLHNKEGVSDDCAFCHVEHRGRNFPIRGGAELCWSCHRGKEQPQNFDMRLMKVSTTRDKDLKAMLEPQVEKVEIGIKFSHSEHDKQTKGDKRFETCVGCHAKVDDGRTFAMPQHSNCIECHDQVGDKDAKKAQSKAGPECLQCHTRGNGEMTKLPPSKFAYVTFSHRDHEKEFCTSCHGPVWEEGPYKSFIRTANMYMVSMDACVTCHEQQGATVGCLDCHFEHHSLPGKSEASVVPGGGGFDKWLIGLLVLTLGGAAYIYADMRVAKKYLEPPPAPPPAAGGAPAGGGAAAAPVGEIMDSPKVDVEACISCGSCYGSCPKQVLAGDDHGKSTIVNPTNCIAKEGCAVCEQGCPTGAIRVSTAPLKRSVERPEIDEHNEAKKVPGLFFAGEVIGAALIKSAINQGADVSKFVAEKKKKVAGAQYDLIIVGAGPAGLGAGLEAKKRKLNYLVLERGNVAQTIQDYPRDKAVLAEPIKMPLYGQLPMMDAQKEVLIATWSAIVKTTGLVVNEHDEVTDVQRKGDVLEVVSTKGKYTGANVLLAIGTRGDPRKLGCPGEAPSCVAYNLVDANDFQGKSVLVVGGGDTAIEAAVALASTTGTKCVLSYRKGGFSRVKKRNQEQIEAMAKSGQLEIVFNSSVTEIKPGVAVLKTEGGPREIQAVQVFALIGADPPKGWIEKKIGVPFVMREEEVVTWS